MSQRERVLSAEAEIRELEKGRKCTALTESTWPLNVDTHTPLRGSEAGQRWQLIEGCR